VDVSRTDNQLKKRGKPIDENLSREALLIKIREISLETDEILNPSKLEKITGIKRRNWNKVQDTIDLINNALLGVDTDAIESFLLPNIDEVFELHFPHNPKKIKLIFQSLIDMVSKMYSKVTSFEKAKEENAIALAERDREIQRLNTKLKEAKKDIEFHKDKYAEICGESTYHSKREELGIPNNVLQMSKGNKNLMELDFQKQFETILKDSQKTVIPKKEY